MMSVFFLMFPSADPEDFFSFCAFSPLHPFGSRVIEIPANRVAFSPRLGFPQIEPTPRRLREHAQAFLFLR